MPNYKQMLHEATTQAAYRANREGKVCVVYRRRTGGEPDVWFVRTEEEGVPDGAECIARVRPSKEAR